MTTVGFVNVLVSAALDTLTLINSGDTTTVIVVNQSRGGAWQWVGTLTAIGTVGVAIFATLQWRRQYSAQQWSKTVELLLKYPQFYDRKTNDAYRTAYTGKDIARYELVARCSLAYLDDTYHLGLTADFDEWLKGSVRVFAYPHRAWFHDNEASYSPYFVNFISQAIKKLEVQDNT
jgi:hypothetical protein